MDNFSGQRFEGKIETFDPCIIDVQNREISEGVEQSRENTELHLDNDNNEATPIHETTDNQTSNYANNSEQNSPLTPIRLPAILDGEFFAVIRIDETNVTVRCVQCQKLINGNLKSTGNFLSHIKRIHPFLLERIKCKSNQRKPAVAYIDSSVVKRPEIVKTKRGYRKCYSIDDGQIIGEENYEQESPEARRRRSEDHESSEIKISSNGSSYLMEDEFDAVGRNVAAKLRSMRFDQRIIAEKLLSDVLFEAQLGTLHRNSNLHV